MSVIYSIITWLPTLGLTMAITSMMIYLVIRSKWWHNASNKLQLLMKVSSILVQGTKPQQASFVINDTDYSATLAYVYNGAPHTICVPFSRRRSLAMSDLQVLLIRSDKSTVNITQQPGIPYLVSAEELGGVKISVTNIDNGMCFSYEHNLVPLYCDEVL